jgi:hypothetical protein
MANRRVIQEKIKNLQQNTANTWSQIGRLILERPNVKVDDTIGPILDLQFKHDPQKDCPDQYVFIKIKVWDASEVGLRGCIYERTYSEYQITGAAGNPITIFRRYRTPFKKIELELEGMVHPPGAPITYKGNPDLLLKGGDVITVEIYSPFILDVKESSISLELLVLDGHVGPEYIGIASMERTAPLMPDAEDPGAKDLYLANEIGEPMNWKSRPHTKLSERDLFDFVGIMQSYEFEYFELLREILLHRQDAVFVMTSVLKFMRDTKNLISKQDLVAFFNNIQPERQRILAWEMQKRMGHEFHVEVISDPKKK